MNQLKQKIYKLFQSYEKELIPLNTITINKSAIVKNLNTIKKLNPQKTILPVLKSNAYGHGISQIITILRPFFHTFIVDSYYEALQIQSVYPQANTILIGSINPINLHLLDFKNISLTLQDKPSLKTLIKLNRPISIHLKINTGMNRQGVNPSDLSFYLKAIKNSKLKLDGLYSHLSDADNSDNDYSLGQQLLFNNCIKQARIFGFNPTFIHLSATAGIPKISSSDINTVRAGIGLYGYNPLKNDDPYFSSLKALTPALSFFSSIVQIHHLKKGDQVSYNRTFTAPKDITIGTICAGYFEGVDRKLSNKGYIKYKNKFLPIIGQVCMNLTVVDFQDTNPKLFDQVEIISSNPKDVNSIQKIAKTCNTIPYEILVHLNSTTKRIIT